MAGNVQKPDHPPSWIWTEVPGSRSVGFWKPPATFTPKATFMTFGERPRAIPPQPLPTNPLAVGEACLTLAWKYIVPLLSWVELSTITKEYALENGIPVDTHGDDQWTIWPTPPRPITIPGGPGQPPTLIPYPNLPYIPVYPYPSEQVYYQLYGLLVQLNEILAALGNMENSAYSAALAMPSGACKTALLNLSQEIYNLLNDAEQIRDDLIAAIRQVEIGSLPLPGPDGQLWKTKAIVEEMVKNYKALLVNAISRMAKILSDCALACDDTVLTPPNPRPNLPPPIPVVPPQPIPRKHIQDLDWNLSLYHPTLTTWTAPDPLLILTEIDGFIFTDEYILKRALEIYLMYIPVPARVWEMVSKATQVQAGQPITDLSIEKCSLIEENIVNAIASSADFSEV